MIKSNDAGVVVHIGLIDYANALDLMHRLVKIKRRVQWPEILLLLQHPAVITLGRRGSNEDILVNEDTLKKNNITVYNVERGGLATYHGPGQLVGYLIMDIKKHGMRPSQLIDHLESAIIQVLKYYDIDATRQKEHRGVWVGNEKIASIGMAIRGGITYHGFALNCSPELSHFDFINPCGLHDGVMTSISKILGQKITPADVVHKITPHMEEHLGIEFSPLEIQELLRTVRSDGMVQVMC